MTSIRKCRFCKEEMREDELVDLDYGQKLTEYNCPNDCEYTDWLDKKEIAKKVEKGASI